MKDKKRNLWWGYLHVNGSYHAQRALDKSDIEEAVDSPFCEEIVMPFEAAYLEDAIRVVRETFEGESKMYNQNV